MIGSIICKQGWQKKINNFFAINVQILFFIKYWLCNCHDIIDPCAEKYRLKLQKLCTRNNVRISFGKLESALIKNVSVIISKEILFA